MERNIKIPGVVIGSSPFGETHRSVRLLTPELGIINAIVYGGRKGKKTALAPLFSYGTFCLYQNPVNNEYSLTDEDLAFSPVSVNNDIHTNCAASYFCETALKLDSQDYSQLYPLLCSSLTVLDSRPDLCDKIIIAYTWKLLIISGVEPCLTNCPSCDREYKEDEILGFSSSMNTPVCRHCADLEFPALLPGCRRFLRYTSNKDLLDILEVEVFEDAQKRIKNYLLAYMRLFCTRSLKTLESGLL